MVAKGRKKNAAAARNGSQVCAGVVPTIAEREGDQARLAVEATLEQEIKADDVDSDSAESEGVTAEPEGVTADFAPKYAEAEDSPKKEIQADDTTLQLARRLSRASLWTLAGRLFPVDEYTPAERRQATTWYVEDMMKIKGEAVGVAA